MGKKNFQISVNNNNYQNFFNFNNLFLDKGCGHKLTHTNKNEISINLFPVCYQSLSIILFCSRLIKSRTPQRFVLCHCLKNLTMGNPVYHSEKEYHCKSVIAIFAWRVTWNYAYSPFQAEVLSSLILEIKTKDI